MGDWHDLEITLRVRAPGRDAEEAVLEIAKAVHDVGVLGVHESGGMEVVWTRLDEDGLPEVSVEDDVDALALALSRIAEGEGEDEPCD